jgi:dolichyl-phosphate-mannose-protein mannosyltransferase
MIPEMKPESSPEVPPEQQMEAKPEITAEQNTDVVPESSPEPAAEEIPEVPPVVVPRTRWQRFLHWEFLGLAVIVLVTLIFHFIAIMQPPTIVWDEVWYVGDVRSIVSGTGELRPEHPPLAKLFMVAGEYIFNGFKTPEKYSGATTYQYLGGDKTNDTKIQVSDASKFTVGTTIRIESEQMTVKNVDPALNQITVERETDGTMAIGHAMLQKIYVYTDNAFGWRFFSIVFGTAGIIVFYFICRKLKFSWKITMVATFLFAFEDMTFVHSGLALLDVYMVTFMLAAVLSYLKEKYVWMGVFLALSANCKLVGVLIFIALFIHWAIYRKNKWKELSIGLVVAAVTFVVVMVWCDVFITRGIENPITRINALYSGTANNLFTYPKLSISSRPWTWLFPQFVALQNEYNVPFIVYSYDPQYISFISTTIQIVVLPVIGYLVYKIIKTIKDIGRHQTAGLIVLWFIATYAIWIPLDIATNRVTFVFYFLPVTPAICIGIAMVISDWLDKLKERKLLTLRTTFMQRAGYILIGTWLFLHLAIWVVFNPAIPVFIKTWLPPFTG